MSMEFLVQHAQQRATNRAFGQMEGSYDAALSQRDGIIRSLYAKIDAANSRAERVETEVMDLKLKIAVKESNGAALQAVVSEYRTLHPDSVLRQVVGLMKDGTYMKKDTAIYIRAFDKAALERRIENPSMHRIG